MKEYAVVMTRTAIVNAENEVEAEEKAFDMFAQNMDSREVVVEKI